MRTNNYVVKRIFIASPGDLNSERAVFSSVISEVNRIKAHSLGVHLEPLGWEDTLPGKGRPQQLINRDLAMCDLFIMVLWKRWGTPSGKFSSGTEEEFNIASILSSQSGRPEIWIFFKAEEIDSIADDNEDFLKILRFRQSIENDKSHLYKVFYDTWNWERMLRDLLCRWLDQTPIVPNTISETGTPKLEKILFEVTYIDWIKGDSKNEIYFTITDDNSFNAWIALTEKQKERFLYDQLSTYLYLTLGCDPFRAMMRYRIEPGRYIILGLISFRYGDSFKQSKIYIPQKLNQVMNQTEFEDSLINFHS